MKKKARQMFAAAAFLLTGLFLFYRIADILREKTDRDTNMIQSFYSCEKNTVDVLCLGSSHAYSSFNPNELWNTYGMTSYVMASPKQTIPMSYYMLQEALQYQKPKVVVLESYYMRFEKRFTSKAMLRLGFDGTRFGKVKIAMVEDFLKNASWKEKASFYLPFLLYHSRWNELGNGDFISRSYRKGMHQDYRVYPLNEPPAPKKERSLPEKSLEYFEKIREICDREGIELVLYAAPCSAAKESAIKTSRRIQEYNLAAEKYAGEQGLPFYNYQKLANEAQIDWSTDFRDGTHMNTYGASKVSRHLGAELKQQYDLEDHRNDPAYESWNKDYEEYLKDEARLKAQVS